MGRPKGSTSKKANGAGNPVATTDMQTGLVTFSDPQFVPSMWTIPNKREKFVEETSVEILTALIRTQNKANDGQALTAVQVAKSLADALGYAE